jgi:hypothetical protein
VIALLVAFGVVLGIVRAWDLFCAIVDGAL